MKLLQWGKKKKKNLWQINNEIYNNQNWNYYLRFIVKFEINL